MEKRRYPPIHIDEIINRNNEYWERKMTTSAMWISLADRGKPLFFNSHNHRKSYPHIANSKTIRQLQDCQEIF